MHLAALEEGIQAQCSHSPLTSCGFPAAALPEQAQLAALDDQFQARVLADAEARAALEREAEALNERWDAELRALAAQHEAALAEVAEDCTARQQVWSAVACMHACAPLGGQALRGSQAMPGNTAVRVLRELQQHVEVSDLGSPKP